MNTQYFSSQDIAAMPKEYRRCLVNSLSGYKGLCLCGTADAQGHTNVSPVSSVVHVGANPPLMGLLLRPDVVPRHTLANMEATGAFTLNHVSEAIYRQAHQASARYPREVSEFEAVGLTPRYGQLRAPYVAESPVQIGLVVQERLRIMANQTLFIVGRVVEVWLPAEALRPDGFLDPALAGSLAGAALDGYYRGERVARLSYAKPDQNIREIDTDTDLPGLK